MRFRAARTGAEEEVIFQQMRVARPARVSRLRCSSPFLLVHNVLLLFTSKDLAEDFHTGDSIDRASGLYSNANTDKTIAAY